VGDIANMTDNDGRVNGFRLLRWLRSRAEMERQSAQTVGGRGIKGACGGTILAGPATCWMEMADDLERELTPPDYPGDDGEDADGEESSTLAPCPGCGELYDFGANSGGACTVCLWLMKPHADDDTVNLDDPAFLGRPEQE
jgi:hypothetical protein